MSDDDLAFDKLAEITAMFRHSDLCSEVPQEWATALIMLLSIRSPTEELVEGKEQNMNALRARIGDQKWCLLYAIEMKEAYIAYQSITAGPLH